MLASIAELAIRNVRFRPFPRRTMPAGSIPPFARTAEPVLPFAPPRPSSRSDAPFLIKDRPFWAVFFFVSCSLSWIRRSRRAPGARRCGIGLRRFRLFRRNARPALFDQLQPVVEPQVSPGAGRPAVRNRPAPIPALSVEMRDLPCSISCSRSCSRRSRISGRCRCGRGSGGRRRGRGRPRSPSSARLLGESSGRRAEPAPDPAAGAVPVPGLACVPDAARFTGLRLAVLGVAVAIRSSGLTWPRSKRSW